jgi:hypothetical protein
VIFGGGFLVDSLSVSFWRGGFYGIIRFSIEKSQWKNSKNEHTSHHSSSINKSIIKKS